MEQLAAISSDFLIRGVILDALGLHQRAEVSPRFFPGGSNIYDHWPASGASVSTSPMGVLFCMLCPQTGKRRSTNTR